MKRISIMFILLVLVGLKCYSQDCDIRLMAINVEDEKAPAAANEYLYNRLCSAVNGEGIAASGNYAQFFIAAKALPTYEQVVPGAPAKTALILSLDLFVGDYFGEKVFDRISLEIRGAGESHERAFLNAYRSLNGKNKQISDFLIRAKERIVNYYDSEYANIIKESERLAQLRDYPRALFLLSSVPICCKGYDAVSKELVKVYKEYINYSCDKLLIKARNAWASSPDVHGAELAGEILNQIEPDAECYGEGEKLYKEIKEKVKVDWNFEMRQKYSDAVDIQKQIIDAAKAVGVAYGKGQQAKTTNIMWLR